MENGEKRHPIQVVARRTGLSADVLRAWEKRYAILAPARSPGGRRLYSDEDIQYLRLITRATAAGRSVGQVAGLSREELATLVREDEREAPAVGAGVEGPEPGAVVGQAMHAVRNLDARALDTVLRRAMLEIEATRFLERVMVPFLTQVGDAWHAGDIRPAHEHLASTVARGVLGVYLGTFGAGPGAPRILLATLSGQGHEFGAMLAAATAAAAGWRVTYLGADLPADDIVAAARQAAAAVVAISLMYPADDPAIAKALRALRQGLSDDVVILAGGAAVGGYQRALREIQAVVLPDLPRLRATLEGLRSPSGAP